MASPLDHAAIRSLTLPETAAYFAQSIQQLGWRAAWDSLRDGIRDGLLPATLVHIFLAQCRHPQPIVEAMRQDWSALARKTAIKHFGRWTRRHDTFALVWPAVGDTSGLLDLMAALSVADVDLLCRTIHLNSRNSADQDARRRNMTDLYNALAGHPNARLHNPDRRPLSHLYRQLVPSCTSDVVFRMTTKNTTPDRATVKAHLVAFQHACLDAIFADPPPTEKLSVWAYVLGIDVDFAFTVLEKLVQSPVHLQHNASCVVWILVLPLAKRLANRREHAPLHARLYDLLFKCLAIEPEVALARMDDLIKVAVKAWKANRSRSDLLDSYLGRLIAISPATSLAMPSNINLLGHVHQQARFPLLKILLRHSPTLQIDLDQCMDGNGTSQNKQVATMLQWSYDLFDLLPPLEAIRLFEGIQDGRVPGSFKDHQYSPFVPQDPGSDQGASDMEYFKASLYARTDCPDVDKESWRDNTTRAIGYRKTRAATAREPADREKWARSAIALSAAAGSIEIYGSTLLWARRFHKDPLVGPKLMTFDKIATALLSGLPDWACFESSNGAATIAEAVLKGNEVVIHVLETAAMLSHEPGFQAHVVSSALKLPDDVVRRRFARIEKLLSQRLITDEWSITHMWAPTIKMLVDAERFLLAEGHQVLGHNHIEGLLNEAFDCSSRHAQWFLDNLAKQRDELWREHRARLRPATTALPAPWPRGLPIPALLPLQFDGKRLVVLEMPYIQARVRAVVFASQASVLMAPPENEEDKEAIGPFTDSYSFALWVFIKSSARSEQERKVAEAWAYATTVLTSDRMASLEAIPFWKNVFYKAGIPTRLLPISPDRCSRVMALPTVTDPSFPVEWNPEPTSRPSRELPTTVLDCMLHAARRTRSPWDSKPSMDDTFCITKSRTSEMPTLWSDRYMLLLPVAERDAFAVAAICLLNAQFGAHPSRFLKTYPSKTAVRIPAVYLDEDFLEKQSKHLAKHLGAHIHILIAISHLSSSIPNDLLIDLARSLFARMEKDEREGKEDPRVREVALFIVRRISYGEQPATACEFVRRVVLERQDDSSWHRQVLDRAFLKNLPAEEAKVFFRDLALAIQKKLQQQRLIMEQKKTATAATAGEKTETTTTTEENQSKPLVKITTIKMIAQLQRWASFADHGFALEILTGLLTNSSHPDVVICIVEGLLQQRLESSDDSIKSNIVEIIAKHIVPLAASLDERSPLTEEAWVKLESGEGRIPEMYSADKEDLAPLMSLLWAAARHPAHREASVERHIWMERVVIPTLHLSAANHMRWTRLFLQRNSLPVSVADVLPAVPHKINMILSLLESYTAYMPADTTATVQRFISVIGFPHLALRGVFRQIQNDKKLRGTPGGQHFLKMWCSEEMTESESGDYKAIKTLVQFLDTLDKDDADSLQIGHTAGLTISGLQRFLIRLSKKHIWNGNLSHLARVLIRTPLDTMPASRSAADAQAVRRRWEHNIRPILTTQLAAIEALEADDEWRRAYPARKLPDTRPYRLEIFTHTHARHADEDHDVGPAAIGACADALLAELDRCLAEGRLHDDGGALQSIVQAAEAVYRKAKHGFMLALRLGALNGAEGGGQGDTLSVMRRNLRVYLARILLERHFQREANEKTPLTEQVFDMVAVSWMSERSGGYVRQQAEALLRIATSRRWISTDRAPRWLLQALHERENELAEMRRKPDERSEAEDGEEIDWILNGGEGDDDGLVWR